MKTGWYHLSTTNSFGGIFHHDADNDADVARERERFDSDLSVWGPYRTFEAAKEDALGYFRCDIDSARQAIREIRATKKPRPKK